MEGSGARDQHEDRVDLATLLRQIGSLDEAELGDAVARLLDSPDVTDTLDELRRHIDDLFRRLDASGSTSAGARDVDSPQELGPEIYPHIEALGRKMDGASRLLAELTDVLESQTERIETIEQQLGDPDYGERVQHEEESSAAAGATADAAAHDSSDAVDALREFLNDRLDRLEGRISDIEARINDVRALALERDRHVRELEERLVILVESPITRGAERPAVPRFGAPAPTAEPVAALDESSPEPGLHAETGAAAAGRPDAPIEMPAPPHEAGEAASGRLAELVEREVRSRREFAEGAVAAVGSDHPTVMVVDDSADARTVLSIYLSKTGYNVVTAASAEDCLAKLRHHRVDAIVLDARMPGADGGHVCRMLREERALAGCRHVPVIVYTAYPDEYSASVAEGWGAADHVVKGGDMLPLITALVRHTKAPLGAPA